MSDLTTLQKNITNLAEAIAADVMALYSKAGGDVTLEELANIVSGHTTSINQLGVSIGNKVDKVAGKGLSTSDFTAAEKSKLTGIATGATKNRADTLNADKVHSHAVGEVIGLVASLADKVDKVAGQGLSSNDLTDVLLAKLNGIAAGATKNATDAQLRARSSHTGTQAISTVTGLQAAIDSKVSTESGKGLSTNDYTTAEKSKLASMESSRFRGTYTTLSALISAVQTPEAGFYADVDSGEGSDVQRHIYDATDDKWVSQQSATDITAAQVKQMYESNPDTNPFRDSDKTKLTGITTGATKNRADTANADKSHSHPQSEVVGLVDSLATKVDKVTGKELTTNDYTTVEKNKLTGIAAGATKNATDAQLRDRTTHTGVQAIATVSGLQAAIDDKVSTEVGKGLSTNDYTTAEKGKLTGIETGAQKNVPTNLSLSRDGVKVDVKSSTGGDVSIPSATSVLAGVLSGTDKTKLDGIATGATKNATDALLRDRSTHTGTQTMSTVVDLVDTLDGKVDVVLGKGLSTNDYTTVEKNKLTGIATGATKNRTDASVDTLLGNKVDKVTGKGLSTKDYTAIEETKLAGIEVGATKNRTDTAVDVLLGEKVDIEDGKGLSSNDYTTVEKNKLAGIATGATKNATDAQLRARSSHTGVQPTSTITGLDAALLAKVDKSQLGEAAGHDYGITVDSIMQGNDARVVNAVPNSRSVIAGTGLTGGGTLAANRTLNVTYGTAAGTAAQGNDSRLSNSREWTASTVSQAEAEAGTATTRRAWTSQRVRQNVTSYTQSYTSAEKTKLSGIADGAQVNVATNLGSSGTGATRTITSSTGSNTSITYSAADVGAVPTARTITAGTGLTGGGNLSANRTLNVSYGTAAGTAAQGNDSRINNGQAAFNRLNIGATAATARTALQLGTAATKDEGYFALRAGTATQDFTTKEVGTVAANIRATTGSEGVKLEYNHTTKSLDFNFY